MVQIVGDLAFLGEDTRDLAQVQADLCDFLTNTRDGMIAGGFPFVSNAVAYTIQSAAQDQENILGLQAAAAAAIAAGTGAPGNLKWLDGQTDFVFITANNDLLPLDAPGMVSLFQAGLAYKSALTFACFSAKANVNAADSIANAQQAASAVAWPA